MHARDFDVAIVNAGGLTHTSISLRDALLGIQRPFIEVHLSDPATREAFRQVNFLHDIALESIVGQGAAGYTLALESIAPASCRRGIARMTRPDEELDTLRERIDGLDRDIVRLLNERARLALEAGRLKAAQGRDGVRDPEREREVLLRVAMANEGPLPQADLVDVYRRIIDVLVALEEHDSATRS